MTHTHTLTHLYIYWAFSAVSSAIYANALMEKVVSVYLYSDRPVKLDMLFVIQDL